jgi:DNA primase catalytic subunit
MKKKQIKVTKPQASSKQKPIKLCNYPLSHDDNHGISSKSQAFSEEPTTADSNSKDESELVIPIDLDLLNFLQLSDDLVIKHLRVWQFNKNHLPIRDFGIEEIKNLLFYVLVRAVDRLIDNEQGFIPDQNYSQQYLRTVLPLHFTKIGDGTWCNLKFNYPDKDKMSNEACHALLYDVDAALLQKEHPYNNAHNYHSELHRHEMFHFATFLINDSLNNLYNAIEDFLYEWLS